MANGSEMIEIQKFNANPGGDLQETEEGWKDTSVNTDVHKESGLNASSTQSTPAHPSGDNNTTDVQHKRNLKVTFHEDLVVDSAVGISTVSSKLRSASPKAVRTIEKKPPTHFFLSVFSALINPLCGALAIWQSCKYILVIVILQRKKTTRIRGRVRIFFCTCTLCNNVKVKNSNVLMVNPFIVSSIVSSTLCVSIFENVFDKKLQHMFRLCYLFRGV